MYIYKGNIKEVIFYIGIDIGFLLVDETVFPFCL